MEDNVESEEHWEITKIHSEKNRKTLRMLCLQLMQHILKIVLKCQQLSQSLLVLTFKSMIWYYMLHICIISFIHHHQFCFHRLSLHLYQVFYFLIMILNSSESLMNLVLTAIHSQLINCYFSHLNWCYFHRLIFRVLLHIHHHTVHFKSMISSSCHQCSATHWEIRFSQVYILDCQKRFHHLKVHVQQLKFHPLKLYFKQRMS